MKTKLRYLYTLFVAAAVFFAWTAAGAAASDPDTRDIILGEAVICEAMENYQPVNPAVVFSMSRGEVFCYSKFDVVQTKTPIFHKWYKQDRLIFTMRLVLSPPAWASFSRIQLRDADKGPWRVEIQDQTGRILQTLRFSISD